MPPVEVGERPDGRIALPVGPGPVERPEEPPAHDLEAFLRARRAPRRLDARHHIAQPFQSFAPADAADLRVIRIGAPAPLILVLVAAMGSGQRDHQQAVLRHLHRFRERLGEGELGLEAAPGRSLCSWSWRA